MILYYGGGTQGLLRFLEEWRPKKPHDVELNLSPWSKTRAHHQGHSIAVQSFGADLVIRYHAAFAKPDRGLTPGDRQFTRHLRTEIGYCLDAPELLPAGSCRGDEFEGTVFPMPTIIEREVQDASTK